MHSIQCSGLKRRGWGGHPKSRPPVRKTHHYILNVGWSGLKEVGFPQRNVFKYKNDVIYIYTYTDVCILIRSDSNTGLAEWHARNF